MADVTRLLMENPAPDAPRIQCTPSPRSLALRSSSRPLAQVLPALVSRFRSSLSLPRVPERTSESQGHWRVYDSSVALDLKSLYERATRMEGTSNPPHQSTAVGSFTV